MESVVYTDIRPRLRHSEYIRKGAGTERNIILCHGSVGEQDIYAGARHTGAILIPGVVPEPRADTENLFSGNGVRRSHRHFIRNGGYSGSVTDTRIHAVVRREIGGASCMVKV